MSLCLKFEEDPTSGSWYIQIFIFWGHLPFEVVFHWRSSSLKPYLTFVWPHEFMFKFEEDPISACWDIQILIIWGHLPFEIEGRLHSNLFLLWFCSMSLCVKFEKVLISGCWDIQIFIFSFLRSSSISGHLPLKVVFIETLFDFGLVPWAYV